MNIVTLSQDYETSISYHSPQQALKKPYHSPILQRLKDLSPLGGTSSHVNETSGGVFATHS